MCSRWTVLVIVIIVTNHCRSMCERTYVVHFRPLKRFGMCSSCEYTCMYVAYMYIACACIHYVANSRWSMCACRSLRLMWFAICPLTHRVGCLCDVIGKMLECNVVNFKYTCICDLESTNNASDSSIRRYHYDHGYERPHQFQPNTLRAKGRECYMRVLILNVGWQKVQSSTVNMYSKVKWSRWPANVEPEQAINKRCAKRWRASFKVGFRYAITLW